MVDAIISDVLSTICSRQQASIVDQLDAMAEGDGHVAVIHRAFERGLG